MKNKGLAFIFLFWFGLSGLTFTSLCFYNAYTKIVLVEEIQEEKGENTSHNDDHGFLKTAMWPLAHEVSVLPDAFIEHHPGCTAFNTSTGHFLDLIKPPLA